MLVITATELKKHFGEYSKIAQTEEIIVTSFGKVSFKLVPINLSKVDLAKSLIGILPNNVTFGVEENERG